jgi:hypothetical protein
MARLTLRSRSSRGTGPSQRFTWLVENISPPITPKPPRTGQLLHEAAVRASCWGGCLALARARTRVSDGIGGIQSRNLTAAHGNHVRRARDMREPPLRSVDLVGDMAADATPNESSCGRCMPAQG